MFVSIEVTDFKNFKPNTHISSEEIESYKSNKERVLEDLKEYVLSDGNTLDGDLIQKHLFPQKEFDIFLSHSHEDEDKVIKLAISLEKRGFSVFVDSCLWGNVFQLLEAVDKEYCYNPCGSTYNYKKRNHSTSHVYMMLNIALHRMIDKCEVFLFLGTPNSSSLKNNIKGQKSLRSSWLLSELAFTKLVHRRTMFKLEGYDSVVASSQENLAQDELNFIYDQPNLDYEVNSEFLTKFLNKKCEKQVDLFKSLYAELEEIKNIRQY